MTCYRGVELDGVVDVVADIPMDDIGADLRRSVIGGLVLEPNERHERWIGGLEAKSIVGAYERGERAHEVVDAVRTMMLAGHRAASDAGDEDTVLTAHLVGMLGGASERTILVVPDTLREDAQQRLLTVLRTASRGPVELVWRPVAAILAWSAGMTAHDVRALDGAAVVHLHAGAHGIEASRYEVAVEDVDGVPYVVPVRSGRGREGPASRLVERARDAAMEADASTHRLGAEDRWSLRVEERPWRIAIGRSPGSAIVPLASGGYRLINRSPARPDVDATAEMTFLSDFGDWFASPPPTAVLVDGVASHVGIGSTSLAEAIEGRLGALGIRVSSLVPGDAAAGGAIYAWRRERGLPTYEDVLPRLRIFARAEGRPAWVDLVPPDERVRGGSTYGPRRVEGFVLGQGTEQVKYGITREDDPTVRLTTTRLPSVAPRSIDVELVVTQKPGQGRATVEIRPEDGADDLEWPGVYLDWSSMEDTDVDPDTYLDSQRAEQGLSYPDIAPFPCHGRAWDVFDVPGVIESFLRAEPSSESFGARAEELMKVLGKKLDPEADGFMDGGPPTHGVVGSDGDVPEWPIRRDRAPAALLSALVHRIDDLIATFEEVRRPTKLARDGFRRVVLAGGWCYASAPPRVLDFARRAIVRPDSLPPVARGQTQYAANVAGRAFTSVEDIRLLFRAVDANLADEGLKNHWMKALQEVLRFRELAYEALDGGVASRFARQSIAVMRSEVEAENVKHRFFNAAALLVGILRYRIVDPGFFAPGSTGPRAARRRAEGRRPERRRVGSRPRRVNDLDEALRVLENARVVARRTGRSRIDGLIQEIGAYLEMRGTDTLLFRRLLDEAEGGG